MPQDWAVDFKHTQPTAMISIVDPRSKNPAFDQPHVSVLNLQFKDFVKPDPKVGTFTESQAEAIASFVYSLNLMEDKIDLIVHCRKGQSRSAAVAKWVGNHLKIPVRSVPGNIGTRLANTLVYDTLSRVDMPKVALLGMHLPAQESTAINLIEKKKPAVRWLIEKFSTITSRLLKR